MSDEQQWLSRKYLYYKFFTNLWFLGAVWLYFYRIFMTDQQVGLLDGLAFAIGIVAEVPSGALADKFGRDKLVRLGQVMTGMGLLLQAMSSSFTYFFIGQTIMMIGVAFVSGADEALFFENISFSRNSKKWRKLVTRGGQVALIGTLLATVVGGYLHTINPRVPWLLTAVSFLFSAVIIWSVQDRRMFSVKKSFVLELQDYLADIKTGCNEFKAPTIRVYVPIILTVQGLFYATGYGLLRLVLLDRFTFSPYWGSLAVAASSLMTIGLLSLMHRHAETMSEKKVITIISMSAAAALLLSLANIGLWGYFVILILYAGEHVLYPFMSEIVNYHAPEKQRATVLSVASFLRTLPYVVLAPIIGYLNTNGTLSIFLVLWPVLIFAAVFYYVSTKKADDKIIVDISLV